MQRKRWIVLLSLVAVFNLLFLLMLANGYSLSWQSKFIGSPAVTENWLMLASGYSLSWQSKFIGSPAVTENWSNVWLGEPLMVPVSRYGSSYATAIVGSVAIILLSTVAVQVKRLYLPRMRSAVLFRSEARKTLRFTVALLIFLALLATSPIPVITFLLLIPLSSITTHVAVILGTIVAYGVVYFLLSWVMVLIEAAVLAKPLKWGTLILIDASLLVLLSFISIHMVLPEKSLLTELVCY